MRENITASNYNNELETYKQKYQQLEKRNHDLEADIKKYQYKYLEIKEQYDLLVYRRFVRSAERALAEGKQQLLFTQEEETAEAATEEGLGELSEVKSYTRKKPGRKPLNPNLERKEIIIDISESEKTCACGATLTRISEETSD